MAEKFAKVFCIWLEYFIFLAPCLYVGVEQLWWDKSAECVHSFHPHPLMAFHFLQNTEGKNVRASPSACQTDFKTFIKNIFFTRLPHRDTVCQSLVKTSCNFFRLDCEDVHNEFWHWTKAGDLFSLKQEKANLNYIEYKTEVWIQIFTSLQWFYQWSSLFVLIWSEYVLKIQNQCTADIIFHLNKSSYSIHMTDFRGCIVITTN